ncbi:hypothetical protein HZZ13_04990 [Bradyrhizobium sp. CNPSo 4010]|uniref:Uncharacterized protein n=1 Tax=Bradyrhizobium agreste TaxID=2751811 RepID=A0ABS0PJ05_9BRAD|nr:hypothetical protein [Bradyrhizobium agreste]MBH5397148.1 hypothetical protein [Bradyrhizobium agreste]
MNVFVGAATLATAAIPSQPEALPAPNVMDISPASPHPDAALFDLIEDCIAAEKRYFEAVTRLDELERPAPPEVLRIRPRDLELGRKAFEASDEFWRRPCDIGQWRHVDQWETEKEETPDTFAIIQRRIPASEELAARGREIVEAFDAWHKRPRGYVKADREVKRRGRICAQLAAEVAATPAATIEGMRAKLRCVEINGSLDGVSGDEPIITSLLYDLQRFCQS